MPIFTGFSQDCTAQGGHQRPTFIHLKLSHFHHALSRIRKIWPTIVTKQTDCRDVGLRPRHSLRSGATETFHMHLLHPLPGNTLTNFNDRLARNADITGVGAPIQPLRRLSPRTIASPPPVTQALKDALAWHEATVRSRRRDRPCIGGAPSWHRSAAPLPNPPLPSRHSTRYTPE